jgi:hypothetical protein
MSGKAQLYDLLKKLYPLMSRDDIETLLDHADDFMNQESEHSVRIAEIACEPSVMESAERAITAITDIWPQSAGKRFPSRDMGMLVMVLVNLLVRVRPEGQEDMLNTFAGSVRMMLRLIQSVDKIEAVNKSKESQLSIAFGNSPFYRKQ